MKQTRPLRHYLRKPAAILTCIAAGLFALCYVLYLFALSMNLKKFLNRLSAKKNEKARQTHPIFGSPEHRHYIKTHTDWAAGIPEYHWTAISFDYLTLKARYFPAPSTSHHWLIAVHGYGSSHHEMFPAARHFHGQNYHTLAVSCRAHEQSQGKFITMGWHERLDLIKWIDKIIARDPEAHIVLHGISMGAAAVMMTAGEPLPPNVKCIIEDCGYTSVMDEFSYQIPHYFKLPPFPFVHIASKICRYRLGFSFEEASALNQIKKSELPILFIHGEEDDFVPFKMVYRLYNAAPGPKQLYTVPDAPHGISNYIAAEDYWRIITEFTQRYVN